MVASTRGGNETWRSMEKEEEVSGWDKGWVQNYYIVAAEVEKSSEAQFKKWRKASKTWLVVLKFHLLSSVPKGIGTGICKHDEGALTVTKLLNCWMLDFSVAGKESGDPHSSTARFAFGKSLPAAPSTPFNAVLLERKVLALSRRLRLMMKTSTLSHGSSISRK